MSDDSLIILDRDGVINQDSADYIKSPQEWIPLPGSIEAIARLSQAGFRIAVASNQSGLAREYFDEYTLAAIHEKMHTLVEAAGGHIEGIFLCPHAPDAGCHCRKPATGLLLQIEEEFATSVAGVWFIGDSSKDLECGLAMGCRPALVLTGKGEETRQQLSPEQIGQISIFADLWTATEAILNAGTA
ncbi:MAG: D-glycero-beta-D-manno-heptose 1,7-bisphosphate 7-phosphatase [Pseudohongiellaceae bacterium]